MKVIPTNRHADLSAIVTILARNNKVANIASTGCTSKVLRYPA